MLTLKDDNQQSIKLNLLLQRMIHLLQAIPEKITIAELNSIANLSTVDLEKKTNDLLAKKLADNDALKKFFDILTDNQINNYLIEDSKKITESLWDFENDHGGYLNLLPLCVENEQTIANSLNDFAIFYQVFIQHVSLKKIAVDKNNSKYILSVNKNKLKAACLHWKKTRPIRLATDVEYNRANNLGIIEKFLAGILREEEWLSDKDLERGLKILGLNEQVHVIPFTIQDLGITFHFEKEKHQKDDPKKPYYIPLILNLGEDEHSRIDDQGNHWVKMLVKVDPTIEPLTIYVDYHDSLFLSSEKHQQIEETIKKALSYHEKANNEVGIKAKFYTAFPEYQPTITIQGSAEQIDGFTCGYRALKGIAADLVNANVIKPNQTQQDFISQKNAYEMRDFIYTKFLCEQEFTPAQFNIIKQNSKYKNSEKAFIYNEKQNIYSITEAVVRGQLYAYAYADQYEISMDPEQLSILGEQSKIQDEITKNHFIQEILHLSQDDCTIQFNDLLTKLKNKDTEEEKIASIKAIFKSLRDNENIQKIHLHDINSIPEKYIDIIKNELDKFIKLNKLVIEHPQLQQYGNVIISRNEMIKQYRFTKKSPKNVWWMLFENILFSTLDNPKATRFEELDKLGIVGFDKFLNYLKENETKIRNGKLPKMRLDTIIPFGKDYFALLEEYLKSTPSFLPINHLVFSLTSVQPDINKFYELLPLLETSGIEICEIGIESQNKNILSVKQIEELIKFVNENKTKTFITFNKTTIENPKILEKLIELENIVAKNRRNNIQHVDVEQEETKNIKLGKIGRAIWGYDSISELNTNTQIQQQQQMQQQIQTVSQDQDKPEEAEITNEVFISYGGNEELITRDNISEKLSTFISNRYGTSISAQECWDLIAGKNSNYFKYGIKALTLSAAQKLIENLKDVRYGLNPHILPQGFYIEENKNENQNKIIVCYDQFNPRKNNKSAAVIQFHQAMQPNQWLGNIEQFLSKETIANLYNKHFKKSTFKLEDCVNNFFYLKDLGNHHITVAHRKIVLEALIASIAPDSHLYNDLKELFNDQFTSQNIAAISEIIYDKGLSGLTQFIDILNSLKTKGNEFFYSFRKCFIDPSKNLCEFLNVEYTDAIENLKTFSDSELKWWQILNEQHAHPMKFEENKFSKKRWSHLPYQVESFSNFIRQLKEIKFDFNLPESCPLRDVYDLNTGLGRLLTILDNARDFDEQFYTLDGVNLDALGPYYASCYEGFRLVTKEMLLELGRVEQNNAEDESLIIRYELSNAEKFCCYRFNKYKVITLGLEKNEKILPYYLRYIATFNYRASLNEFKNTFTTIINLRGDKNLRKPNSRNSLDMDMVKNVLIGLVLFYATGKQGQHFTRDDLKKAIENVSGSMNVTPFVNTLLKINIIPSKIDSKADFTPTLAQINCFIDYLIKNLDENKFMSFGKPLITVFERYKLPFINTLDNYYKISNPLRIDNIIEFLAKHENSLYGKKLANPGKEDESNDSKKRIHDNLAKVLILIKNNGSDPKTEIREIKKLYEKISDFIGLHGLSLTEELTKILSCISVTKSDDLPSLNNIITIITILTLTVESTTDNNQLLKRLTELLTEFSPKTVIDLSTNNTTQVTAPVGDLYTIIEKYKRTILEKLEPNKNQIDMALGSGFLDSLKTSEGTAILLQQLDNVKSFSGFMGDVVQKNIISLMRTVYDECCNSYIVQIHPSHQENFKSLLKRINHPIKKIDDFNQFCTVYPVELKALEDVLAAFRIISQQWPSEFWEILNALQSPESTINSYRIYTLAKIISAFATHSDQKQSFPSNTLKKFFTIKELTPALESHLVTIIEKIFPDKHEELPSSAITLNAIEKCKLCSAMLDIILFSGDQINVVELLPSLIALKTDYQDRYEQVIDLLMANKQPLNKFLEEIKLLFNHLKNIDNTSLVKDLINILVYHMDDFSNTVNTVVTNPDKLENIVFIINKLFNLINDSQSYVISDIVTKLNQLEPHHLAQLSALYSLPKCPGIEDCHRLLISSDINKELNDLEIVYDKSPEQNHRSSDAFSIVGIDQLINSMQDLNYHRPILYSQKKQLYRWYLYVNAIAYAHKIPVPTNSSNSSEQKFIYKTVKDLTGTEIKRLFNYYKQIIRDEKTTDETRIKCKLEFIAIAKEAMFRRTGNYPWPTQTLYLLAGLQNNENFAGQIQTGQGKSLIAALTASILALDGETIDICTSDLFLANEGLETYKDFFDYLGIPVKLIDATSKADDYTQGGIHYSSMEDLALFRAKTELHGKVFSSNSSLILDECDYSILDQKNQFRYAMNLDEVTNPMESPYKWVYEALIDFTSDQIKQKKEFTDDEYIERAKTYLEKYVQRGNKSQRDLLKNLKANPESYKQRLSMWLIAAARTERLVEQIENQYRVISPLKDEKFKQEISKACILKGARPDIQSEFSDSVQQFLHVRLNKIYADQIQKHEMVPFLVEPEKTYVSSYNTNILMHRYKKRWCMSGTVGSTKEISEQYSKYKLNFVQIPPFQTNQRIDLNPILTSTKYINNPEKEEQEHIRKIVTEVFSYLNKKQSSHSQTGPILILCKNKTVGNKIKDALSAELAKNTKKYNNTINEYYSSEKATPKERNEEERQLVETAAKNGMITISSVFGRGTDIKPDHKDGLYLIDTYVNTEPFAEDLERSKRQKIGRAGRKGQKGQSRLIIKRSEFKEVYNKQQLCEMTETKQSVEQAIGKLNVHKNQSRVINREMAENFAVIKDLFYQKILQFSQILNQPAIKQKGITSQLIDNYLFKEWNTFLISVDEKWVELQESSKDFNDLINCFSEFCISEWDKLLTKMFIAIFQWSVENNLSLHLSRENFKIEHQNITDAVYNIYPELKNHYVRQKDRLEKLDLPIPSNTDESTLLEQEVYCDFAKNDKNNLDINDLKSNVVSQKLNIIYQSLTTEAHKKKLRHLNLCCNNFDASKKFEHVNEMVSSYLYLQYQAYRQNNMLAYALLNRRYKELVNIVKWSKEEDLITAVSDAQKNHYQKLSSHQGNAETRKSTYFKLVMADFSEQLPDATEKWKNEGLKEFLRPINKQIKDWLEDYRDKWWSRKWVSDDRKNIVTSLLDKLKSSTSPMELIEFLNNARQGLLQNDQTFQRSLHAGLDGRLFQFIDDAKQRIFHLCNPENIDKMIDSEFTDIVTILKHFQWKFKDKKIDTPLLDNIIEKLNSFSGDVEAKYDQLLKFFADIEAKAMNEDLIWENDFKLLYRFCQTKRDDLVYYFSQSSKFSDLPKKDAVGVYRAISKASAGFIANLDSSNLINQHRTMPDHFSYRNYTVQYKNELGDLKKSLNNERLFNLINHPQSYASLLFEIEKAMVESRKQQTVITFDEITLAQSKKYNTDGFQLKIQLTVNNMSNKDIILHVNTKLGTVYYDYDEKNIFKDLLIPSEKATPVAATAKKNTAAFFRSKDDTKFIPQQKSENIKDKILRLMHLKEV